MIAPTRNTSGPGTSPRIGTRTESTGNLIRIHSTTQAAASTSATVAIVWNRPMTGQARLVGTSRPRSATARSTAADEARLPSRSDRRSQR